MDIKRVIKQHNLTVKEVAERLEITAIGLSQHINGNPSVQVLERIAAAIGCKVGDFFENSADFLALVRKDGQIHTFDTVRGLKDYTDVISAESETKEN